MLSVQDMELRERCVALALGYSSGGDPVNIARRFYDFIKGEDEKSPRERILQAMEDAGVS